MRLVLGIHQVTNEEAMALGAHCHICPLKGSVLVPPQPATGRLRLVIVGEVPGRADERVGVPFQGMGGKLLDVQLRLNKVPRTTCHVTNVALCRGETDKENERGAECCAPRLLRELRELDSKAGGLGLAKDSPGGIATGRRVPILTLGKAPLRALLNLRSLLVARGFLFDAKHIEYSAVRAASSLAAKGGPKKDALVLKAETLIGRRELEGALVLPALHPSFILRADTWLPLFKIDVARAARASRGEIVTRDDEGAHEVGGLEVLKPLGSVVSCDIETDDIDPMTTKMLCVGVSDGERTAVIWPWKASYAKRFSKWMRTKKGVVFHNGL